MKKQQVKSKRVTMKKKSKSKSKAVVSRSFGISSLRSSKGWQWAGIGIFALVGAALLFRSFANPIYSSKPSDIVLQYVQPHNDVYAVDQLSDAHYPPFTLYGNGLLVCSGDDHVYTAPTLPEAGATHEHSSAPTARTLSKTEMAKLVQGVRDTGFENLDSEYFTMPVAQNEYTIRLVTKGSDKAVLYYNDVAAPAAYTQTLALMKDACAATTQPYVSATATVRARPDVNTTGKEVDPIDGYDQQVVGTLKDVMNKSKASKRQNDAQRAANQEPEGVDEETAEVSGATAQILQKAANGQAKKYVSLDGTNYAISVDPDLPAANNPMDIDYNKVRAETDKKKAEGTKSASSRLLEALDPTQKVDAATTGGYRIVVLLASNAGSTSKLDEAQAVASKMNQWTCKEVGKCPVFKGVTYMRGSQTQAYYNACHIDSCQGNQLLNILYNVYLKDAGTISRTDVATLIVPGWKTNTLSTSGTKACGWGFHPGNLGAVDLYQTEPINGLTCVPLSKAFPHEYLHNRGLGHISFCSNRNLMDGPPGCKYSNGCTIVLGRDNTCLLSDNQADKLKANAAY